MEPLHTADESDVFSVLLRNPALPVEPILEIRAEDWRPRAVRYRLRTPVRYKWADRGEWHLGTTANVSRSGVLFELDTTDPRVIQEQPARPGTSIDLRIELPPNGGGDVPQQLCGEARFVRASAVPGRWFLQASAVTVEAWRLVGKQ